MDLTAVPRAAVALLIAREPSERILLIRRAERAGDAWSGHWAVPGGRIERGESAEQAARRELAEEVGIDLQGRAPDRRLPVQMAGRHVGQPVPVAPFLWLLPQELPTRPEPGEVALVHWLPLADLGDPTTHGTAALVPGRPGRAMPFLPVCGHPLWGFTYQLLVGLVRAPPD